jgi:prepilin-type N-terminal cleavage/methylation domain-containing protein/prepilin-type processing-associated H-X9-DG protein
MTKSRSRGFTLVEVLVVIAIIGVLIGILLPAVQSARESGRRAQCATHLREIGLALNSYASVRRRFPPGAMVTPDYPDVRFWYDPWAEAACTTHSQSGSPGSSNPGFHGTSWILHILPYIELNDIYSQWNFSKGVIGNEALARQDIQLLYCPSRRVGMRRGDEEIMFENWTSGGTDYGGCLGRCNGWRNEYSGDYSGPPRISHKFLYGSTLFEEKKRGVFGPHQATKTTEIHDGLSNTIMIGEMQRLHPSPDAEEYEKYNRTSNDGWALAGVATLFNTMLAQEGGDLGAPGGFNNWFFESAGSEHPSGANFGMADGSVHFIDENIDSQVYAWLGSIADGETARVPQ